MVQWLRVCLEMQETPVPFLVWEDPTCQGAAKPVGHNNLNMRTRSLCSETKGSQEKPGYHREQRPGGWK